MIVERAPGLTADWLNGWLAAIGITVLVDGCHLRWTCSPRPVAELLHGNRSLGGAIAVALPSAEDLDGLAISNRHKEFPRNINVELFQAVSDRVRSTHPDFSLAASVTDLQAGTRFDAGKLPHSRFDPSAPRGETLWNRLLACRQSLPTVGSQLESAIAASLAGWGQRVQVNGLGFDVRRLEAGDPPTGGKFVDPVVECLAFYGLAFFPVRGNGTTVSTRGWLPHRSDHGRRAAGRSLRWPAWEPTLDRWAIDALLGRLFAGERQDTAAQLGVTRMYEVVPYRKTGDMDQTAGYGARAV